MKIQFKKEGIGNQWMHEMVNSVNAMFRSQITINNNNNSRITFPPDIAEGTCSYQKLSEDVEVAIFDITFKYEMIFERSATLDDRYYTMHINCSPIPVEHSVNGKKNKMGGVANSGICWTASDVVSTFKIESGKKFQAVLITMTKEYLRNVLWDAESPSHSCTLRDKATCGCVLKGNGAAECELNNGKEKCAIGNKEHIIGSSLYTSIGTAKYALVQEIINFEKEAPIPEKIVITGDVLKILALFIRRIAQERKKKFERGLHFGDASKIIEIKKTIDESAHYKHFRLDELTKLVGMSKTKMKMKFKEIVGTSIYKYYLDVRMERAKEMLHNGPQSVTHLAYEMGFKTVSHFSQLFRKYYGVNPNAIIAENRKNR